ncbi:MAG: cytochrome c [Gemmatimonadota bacterium]|nr:cytochrome c [Gemmatimonadota bacterium]
MAITIALLGLGAFGFLYSGAYDVSATSGHTDFVHWILDTTQRRSIAARADAVPSPPAADQADVEHGFEHYRAMCVVCHGAPGVERGEFGKGMTPLPPDLAEEAAEMSARELFWVTKHGVKLAGMPAFGPTHSDEEIWGIVAFLERLPDMSDAEYARWEARASSSRDSTSSDAGHAHPSGSSSHTH